MMAINATEKRILNVAVGFKNKVWKRVCLCLKLNVFIVQISCFVACQGVPEQDSESLINGTDIFHLETY